MHNEQEEHTRPLLWKPHKEKQLHTVILNHNIKTGIFQ